MIFDTDVLIWASRLDPLAKAFVITERNRAASIVTLMELFEGAKSKAELATMRQFFVDLDVRLIPVDEQISYTAANILESRRLADGLDLTDALIAATARERGETLATANYRHFHGIPNLQIHRFHPFRRS